MAVDLDIDAQIVDDIARKWDDLDLTVAGVARNLVATVPTSSDISHTAGVALKRVQRLAAKPNTASSSKASSVTEARKLAAKAAAATTLHTASMAVGGTVSFTVKVAEAKNSKLRRVAPPTVSGLTRTFQGLAPTASLPRATIRRAVRRTGKWSTADSAKATTTTKIRAITAKGPISSKAKAVLSTTTTTGNAPAIPATLVNGVPANNCFMWGENTVANTSFTTFTQYKTDYGFNGVKGVVGGGALIHDHVTLENQPSYFYFQGTDVTNIVDPRLNTTDGHFDYMQAFMGYGVPSVNGGTYGTIHPSNIGPCRYKREVDPTYRWYLGWKLRVTGGPANPYAGDWYDDTIWTEYERIFKNFAAGLKFMGADGMTFDWESAENFEIITTNPRAGALVTSTNRPPVRPGMHIFESDTQRYMKGTPALTWVQTTLPAINAIVSSRGYQVGTALFSAYPNCSIIMYEYRIAGGPYDSVNRNFSAPTYPRDQNLQDLFIFGIMQAMQEANSTGYFWEWDAQYYKSSYMSAGGSNFLSATQRGMQNAMALMSQRLSAPIRDYMMSRFAIICASWAGTDANNPQTAEPDYAQTIARLRQYSMAGWRSEYTHGYQNNAGPVWSQGTSTTLYHDVRGINPPGDHRPGLQTVKDATPQDTMTVAGSVGIYQVVTVGHGASPQATVECELTATVTNNSSGNITAPGVGFYDATTNAQVGFGASGGGTLAPGASQTFSTLTSPVRSAYIPATAGDVVIRAKPGASGVDQNQGVLDQTITIGAAPPPPPAGTRLWSDTSPWNTVKSQSGIVFAAGADGALSGAPVNLNFDFSFNHPTYFASVSDHLVTINLGHSQIDGHTGGTLSKNAPAGMQPATGGDNVMFIQFTDGTYIDGYAVTKNSDTNFTFGEYVYSVDAGHGDATTATGFGFPGDGHRAGTTGIGSAQAGGTLLKRDVQAGSIPHGIFIAGTWDTILGDGLAGTPQVLPAINNDVAGHHGPVPEGGLMLIPTATTMPGGLTAMEQQLFTTLKTYGAYCCDTTASGNFYVVYSDGSAECNAAFTGAGVQTVCHLLRLVQTW